MFAKKLYSPVGDPISAAEVWSPSFAEPMNSMMIRYKSPQVGRTVIDCRLTEKHALWFTGTINGDVPGDVKTDDGILVM